MKFGEPIANRIAVIAGDITRQRVEAIVNAANTTLLGGGGVDGAIHRAAGPELLAECRALGGCATGQAKITRGYNLPAKWVIHTVGPVWQDGRQGEDELLASCYRSCFALVEKHGIRTVAFPAISAGVYGFPMERAARIAVRETKDFLERNQSVEKVILICFDASALEICKTALRESSNS
jgi:O-acetyl-ADP-ribose deacetylase (regulator of RNase III)